MKTVITAKVRLYPNQEQVTQFKAVTKEYQRLCNLVSQWYFDNDCKVNRKKFNQEMYHYLRAESKEINSAMVQSTYRTVEARYKTVETQLKQRPYRYQDRNTGEWYREFVIYLGCVKQLNSHVHKLIMCVISTILLWNKAQKYL